MSLFGDSPRSRFNIFGHRTGCTIISSRLAFQKYALKNLQRPVQEDIPKNKSGYHFATPCLHTCQDGYACVETPSQRQESEVSCLHLSIDVSVQVPKVKASLNGEGLRFITATELVVTYFRAFQGVAVQKVLRGLASDIYVQVVTYASDDSPHK